MALPRLLAALAVTSCALAALATTASASPDKPLISGDARATAHAGNVAADHDDACTVGGLAGTPIATGQFTFTGGKNQADLDITAAPAGVTVTGVVVKGGPAYNVYLAGSLDALPWNDLHAPVNASDGPAAISHWYACGVQAEQPPAKQLPAEQPPASDEEQPAAPASSTPAAPAGAQADELAATGFGSPWLAGLGTTLVVAGAGVLFLLRRRKV